jgi:hypothetical protein
MLRRAGLLIALTVVLAGCSIDRVEWESSGFPVEEVAHALEEEHGATDPVVECIQREAQGAEWECRAHTADAEYHCHAVTNAARERVYEIHCESHHAEGEEAGEEGHEETSTAEHEEKTSTAGHQEDEPAETERAEQEEDSAAHE